MGELFEAYTEITFDEIRKDNPAIAYEILKWNDDLPTKFCLHELSGRNLMALIDMWKRSLDQKE